MKAMAANEMGTAKTQSLGFDQDEVSLSTDAEQGITKPRKKGGKKQPAVFLDISHAPRDVQELLNEYDLDGDGQLDVNELLAGAKAHGESKLARSRLFKISSFLAATIVLVVAILVGMMFVAVEVSKETTAGTNGVLTVKGDEGTVVQVASVDMLIDSGSGMLKSRVSASTPTDGPNRRLLASDDEGSNENRLEGVVGTASAVSEQEVASLGSIIYFSSEEVEEIGALSYYNEDSNPPMLHRFEVKGHTIIQGSNDDKDYIDMLLYTSLPFFPVLHISQELDNVTQDTLPPGLVQLLSADQAGRILSHISDNWRRFNITAVGDDDMDGDDTALGGRRRLSFFRERLARLAQERANTIYRYMQTKARLLREAVNKAINWVNNQKNIVKNAFDGFFDDVKDWKVVWNKKVDDKVDDLVGALVTSTMESIRDLQQASQNFEVRGNQINGINGNIGVNAIIPTEVTEMTVEIFIAVKESLSDTLGGSLDSLKADWVDRKRELRDLGDGVRDDLEILLNNFKRDFDNSLNSASTSGGIIPSSSWFSNIFNNWLSGVKTGANMFVNRKTELGDTLEQAGDDLVDWGTEQTSLIKSRWEQGVDKVAKIANTIMTINDKLNPSFTSNPSSIISINSIDSSAIPELKDNKDTDMRTNNFFDQFSAVQKSYGEGADVDPVAVELIEASFLLTTASYYHTERLASIGAPDVAEDYWLYAPFEACKSEPRSCAKAIFDHHISQHECIEKQFGFDLSFDGNLALDTSSSTGSWIDTPWGSGLAMVVRSSKTNDVYLTFKGSDEMMDWFHDMRLTFVSMKDIVGNGGCSDTECTSRGFEKECCGETHAGFGNMYTRIREQLMAKLLVEIAEANKSGDSNTWKLVITGHSMGGALASIAVIDLMAMRPDLASRTHAISWDGAPVGDQKFVDQYKSFNIASTTRFCTGVKIENEEEIYYLNDPVVHTPIVTLPWTEYGLARYAHVAEKTQLECMDDKGDPLFENNSFYNWGKRASTVTCHLFQYMHDGAKKKNVMNTRRYTGSNNHTCITEMLGEVSNLHSGRTTPIREHVGRIYPHGVVGPNLFSIVAVMALGILGLDGNAVLSVGKMFMELIWIF